MECDIINLHNLIILRDPLFNATLEYSASRRNKTFDYAPSDDSGEYARIYCHICLDFADAANSWTACATRSHFLRDASEGYCFRCMKQYLVSRIRDAQISAAGLIACPCRECDVTIDKAEVLKYVDDEWVVKFDNFVRLKRVSSDPYSRWCPRPGCDSIIRVEDNAARALCPKCNLIFCAKCSSVHSPIFSCRMV